MQFTLADLWDVKQSLIEALIFELVSSHGSVSPLSTVLGLINCCAQYMVAEVVLLVPLLFRLRQPGADAMKLGPTVEEENWSGLQSIKFSGFRENIQLYSDKRRWICLKPIVAFFISLKCRSDLLNYFIFHPQEDALSDPGALITGYRDASAPGELVISGCIWGPSWVFRPDRSICRTADPESVVQTEKMWWKTRFKERGRDFKGEKPN